MVKGAVATGRGLITENAKLEKQKPHLLASIPVRLTHRVFTHSRHRCFGISQPGRYKYHSAEDGSIQWVICL